MGVKRAVSVTALFFAHLRPVEEVNEAVLY